MNRPARLFGTATIVVLIVASAAAAQTYLHPARQPIVTAERTDWYLSGEPITFEGSLYYQVGPRVHFNGYEMRRSGSYRGIPLYIRTTLEPYSIVFVPLRGGVMQPYERRRDGQLVGTVGTTAPGLPVVVATRANAPDGLIPQAAAPAVVIDTGVVPESPYAGHGHRPAGHAPVGSLGRIPAVVTPTPYEPLVEPTGLNAVYVEFRGQRWFPRGGTVSTEGMRLRRIGDLRGFPVYATGANAATIYIPVTRDARWLTTPFTRKR